MVPQFDHCCRGRVRHCATMQRQAKASFSISRVIHDGIYGKYQNERRPRVALPACAIMQVRRLWPQNVTSGDMLAAGHRARSAPSEECEE